MEIILENDFLKAIVKQKGAELASLVEKSSGIEYMWQADPKFWNRHAPVLFPIVGRLNDNSYEVNSRQYGMSQHGFARDLDFYLLEQEDNYVELALIANEVTKEKYPYNFLLKIRYELSKEGILTQYTVSNAGEEPMFFSIGGHPGFNWPLIDVENPEDYVLEFEKNITMERVKLDGPYVSGREEFLENTNQINLTHDLFDDDAIIFDGIKDGFVKFYNPKLNKGLKFIYDGFKYLAFWSKPKEKAPFLCIEPWCGIADSVGFEGTLKEKRGIEELDPQQSFTCRYTVELF